MASILFRRVFSELTVSSFSSAGIDSSLSIQEGSAQIWSCVISNSSVALKRTVWRLLLCLMAHLVKSPVRCFTCFLTSDRTGAKAAAWSRSVRASSATCLLSPRPGQGKMRGRLDVWFWSSDRQSLAWACSDWHDCMSSTTAVSCLVENEGL